MLGRVRTLAELGTGTARMVRDSGMLHPVRPDRAARLWLPYRRYGPAPATVGAMSALRFPRRTAVIDEDGPLTYEELERRAAALAAVLRRRLGDEGRTGVLCRNHRGFVIALLAASRLGNDVVLLNADMSGPQLGEVLRREGVAVLVHDEEFGPAVNEASYDGIRLTGEDIDRITAEHAQADDVRADDIRAEDRRADDVRAEDRQADKRRADDVRADDRRAEHAQADDVQAEDGRGGSVPGGGEAGGGRAGLGVRGGPRAGGRLRARRPSEVIVLTSGTTGAPKGARHDMTIRSLLPAMLSHLRRVPLRSGEPIVVTPPLFHILGLAYCAAALGLGAPLVLMRRFDAKAALEAVERHRARALIAVPATLRRILDVPDGPRPASLKAVVCGGSALHPHLSEAFMDSFGDVLHNVYGATETGWTTISTPADLRTAPGTVGRPSLGMAVKVLDAAGNRLPAGEVGEIHTGGGLRFTGYTGGGDKPVRDGLVASGDLGHFDADGRLFVDGRADDMIVSGGENVFPGEVEDLLGGHVDVAEVSVTGVADERFGQRLAAHVVRVPDAAVTEDELKEYVRRRLARFKVPRDVVFVDELPRTATGKIRSRDL